MRAVRCLLKKIILRVYLASSVNKLKKIVAALKDKPKKTIARKRKRVEKVEDSSEDDDGGSQVNLTIEEVAGINANDDKQVEKSEVLVCNMNEISSPKRELDLTKEEHADESDGLDGK